MPLSEIDTQDKKKPRKLPQNSADDFIFISQIKYRNRKKWVNLKYNYIFKLDAHM